MKTPALLLVPLAILLSLGARADESYDAALKRAAAEYQQKLSGAAEELIRTRTQIADEKAPLLKEMRAAEDRIIAADSQIRLLETGQQNNADERRRLLKNIDASRKTASFISATVRDGAKAFGDGLGPGEAQILAARLQQLQQKLDEPAASGGANAAAAADLADLLLERTEQALGGYTAKGQAVLPGNNRILPGTFAFAGPSTFFRPAEGGTVATVWGDSVAAFPVAYPMPEWNPGQAAAFFSGQPGSMMVDITGGKALRLKETQGTVLNHIRTGGVVAYIIVAVGLFALGLMAQKILDLARMKLGAPEEVRAFLTLATRASKGELAHALVRLKGTTRQLFTVGVERVDASKAVLEEHLQSVLMQQQQFFERRLPLLAVIATAAPLMGLLGTVVGMVKTFALITVFGTGNAAKLASGISQVLVATELGLIVAIPTLIAHGFLAHRIHKNLATLERHALEFVTATSALHARSEIDEETKPLPV
jgi:biopolymer transport protein ExbB